MFAAELTKLKRSSLWVIAVLLPVLAIITGTGNYQLNRQALSAGWASLTSQIVLFYGLFFFSIGISLLAAAAWRMEHRGTNWHLLMTTTRRPTRLVLAKTGAIALPVACMQAVLVLGTLAAGTLVARIDGPLPGQFVAVCALSVIAALPLVAVQSLLAMLLRPFAAPVAICLLGCVLGFASVTSPMLQPLGYVLPQAIVTRSLSLGSTAMAGSGSLTVVDALPIVGAAVLVTGATWALSVLAIHRVTLR